MISSAIPKTIRNCWRVCVHPSIGCALRTAATGTMEPRGSERHRRAAYLRERAGANESNALQSSCAPVAKNAMARRSGDMIGRGRDKLSVPQMCKRRMHGAFGESGCLGDCADTSVDAAPFVSCGLAVKVHVNHKRGRLLVVPDQIAHQHIQHVIVNGNGPFETRHRKRMS